eukprot:6474485-Amphidinium_carterae.1
MGVEAPAETTGPRWHIALRFGMVRHSLVWGCFARCFVADRWRLSPPAKPVSQWAPQLKFEAQLEDFMKMTRKGLYNRVTCTKLARTISPKLCGTVHVCVRYVVLGKLPPELRTGEAGCISGSFVLSVVLFSVSTSS